MGTKPLVGRAFVKVDGQQITLTGAPKVTPEQFIREPVQGLNSLAAFKETYQPPVLEIETIAAKDLDLEILQKGTDMAVTVELLDKRQYSMTGVCLVEVVEIDLDEGKVNLKFVGSKGIWL